MVIADEMKKKQRRKTRLKISFQITAIVLIIFILGCGIGLVFFSSSLNRLTTKSKDKILESVGKLVAESHNFTSSFLVDTQVMSLESGDTTQLAAELEAAKADGGAMPSQQSGAEFLTGLVDSGILGVELACYALPPTEGVNSEPIIIGSSDDRFLYEEIPDELFDIAGGGSADFEYFKGGIPALGLEGEYLVSSYEIQQKESDIVLQYFDFKPVGDLISSIDSFYDKENRRAFLLFGIVMGSSILGFIIISFLVLGDLIKNRILSPIDELSEAAEEVTKGDLSVRVDIKPGEEFFELKRAFNNMISSLDKIVNKKFGKDETGNEAEIIESRGGRFKPKSRTLIQVVALFTILFILSGAASILVINHSMNNYVEKSKEALIETEAELIDSSHEFGLELVMLMNPMESQSEDSEAEMLEFVKSFNNREVSFVQEEGSKLLGNMVRYGLFGFVLVYDVLPPSPLSNEYIVAISSDLDFIYTTPPEGIIEMLEKGEDSYELFENGFPEMGLEGAFLVTTFKFGETPGSPLYFWSVEFKPMEEEITDIDNFYQKESRVVTLTMVIAIAIGVIMLSIAIYILLGYLIRKQITEPIDELVAVSGEVMEGDLDVEVPVKPGEEFEGLKKAFNQMIAKLRDLLEQSTG